MNLQFNSKNSLPKSSSSNHFEVVHVVSKKVSCDGIQGYSGHPRVYLNMGEKDHVVCPYCSKKFVLEINNKN